MKTRVHLIFIVSIILIVVLHYLGLFEALNQWIYDSYIVLNQQKTTSNQIVLVKIDNKSIQKLGSWPWKRDLYVKELKKIIESGPAVIGIGLAFTEKVNNNEDRQLYSVLKSFKNIVLTTKFKTDNISGQSITLPQESIFPDIATGHAYIKYGEKSVIRSFPLYKMQPAFALLILKLYSTANRQVYENLPDSLKKLIDKVDKQNFDSEESILIDYRRTTHQFRQISFLDLVENKYNPEMFKNKIVIIGLTDISRTNIYATPYTGRKTLSSSAIELQAQIIDSLLGFRNLQQWPDWVIYIISILIVPVFFYLMRNRRLLIQGISFVCILLMLIIVDYLLFKYMAIWYPPALSLILITFAFALSTYLTTTRLDEHLITTINKYKEQQNLPLMEIPENVESRVDSLTTLLDIINTDRQTIKAILEGVNNGILVFDQSGKVIWANEQLAQIFKDSLILETHINKLIPELEFEQVVNEINRNQVFKKEVASANKEFLCIVNPINSAKGMYVVILNDITELKETDRLKTDMVRMVSHELKNPLMVVQICSENISFLKEIDKINENNDKIFEASGLMLETINNFLNINKLESNLMNFDIKRSNLTDLINKVIPFYQPIADEKNITIRYNLQQIPEVLMDEGQISIVINNLVSNAIKYSLKDSVVEIQAEKTGGLVKFSVRDSGIGIPENEIDMVFEKFFRSENNKKYKIKGTGLGLSITKRIVELHSGEIEVISRENEGSCFTFTLPVA